MDSLRITAMVANRGRGNSITSNRSDVCCCKEEECSCYLFGSGSKLGFGPVTGARLPRR